MGFGQISSSFASRNMDEQLELKIVGIADDDDRPYICSRVGRSATVCDIQIDAGRYGPVTERLRGTDYPRLSGGL